jgi:hypothetical protein
MNTTEIVVFAIALCALLLEFATRADLAVVTVKPQSAISFDIGSFFDAYR